MCISRSYLVTGRNQIKKEKAPLMMIIRPSLIALAVAVAGTPLAMASQADSKGFVEGSSLTLTNRNYYFNHDRKDGRDDSHDWAHALLLDYASGFTQGPVGFGVDAFAHGVLKLDGRNGGAGNLHVNNDGETDSFAGVGASVKLRLSETTLKYGILQPYNPVLAAAGSRIKPQKARGFELTSNEISDLSLQAGHFTAATGYRGNSTHDVMLALYAGIEADSVDYLGGDYRINDNLSASLYASEYEDVWRQYYTNLNYSLPLADAQSLGLDFNLYRSKDTGSADAGEVDNTAWSLAGSYAFGAHKLTLGYQQVDGDEPFDYVGFGSEGSAGYSIYLANSVHFSDFNGPGEKSVQLRYDLDMADYGVPGLSFMLRHLQGDDIDGSKADAAGAYAGYYGSNDEERETDLEAKYVFQSGELKDLSLRVRQAWHRGSASTGGYQNQFRLMVEYPMNLL